MPNNTKWAGAKWWKFDFHAHSPASCDYGKGENQEQLKKMSPREWLLNFMRAGIDCVAVTDHNTGDWIDPLQTALEELREEEPKPEGYRELYLFPGIEIMVHGNLHLLAIFPFEKNTTTINALLGAIEYDIEKKGECDSCTELPFNHVVQKIVEFGGIPIPAHVDQNCGCFRECERTTLRQIVTDVNVYAMEIIDSEYLKPQIYHEHKTQWTAVVGSDSHHPTAANEDQQCPGSRYTWIKMSEPSFEGLRLALVDGELSTKHYDKSEEDPNSHADIIIENISIDEARHIGIREQVFSCSFNPWLNTVIGGRGTGKSTVLEFLRLALDRLDEIPGSLKSELQRYHSKDSRHPNTTVLADNTKITVTLTMDEARFQLTWPHSDEKIQQEDENGKWKCSDGEISSRFPIRIYSQKQIFEHAKDPQSLMKIIDDSPQVNRNDWKQRWDTLVSNYMSTSAAQRDILSKVNKKSEVRGSLEDVKRKISIYLKGLS